jgi:hypothetical protein
MKQTIFHPGTPIHVKTESSTPFQNKHLDLESLTVAVLRTLVVDTVQPWK